MWCRHFYRYYISLTERDILTNSMIEFQIPFHWIAKPLQPVAVATPDGACRSSVTAPDADAFTDTRDRTGDCTESCEENSKKAGDCGFSDDVSSNRSTGNISFSPKVYSGRATMTSLVDLRHTQWRLIL